nr:NAC domain-containing protein [Tanacetum cinerariifolium]
LTANSLAAVTLGGEVLGLEDGCQGKCLLSGDLDLETACEARLGRVLENFDLTTLTCLAAVVVSDDLRDALSVLYLISAHLRTHVTIKSLVMTNHLIIQRISHDNLTVVRSVEEMLSLRNSNHDPPVDLYYPEGSDDYIEVTYDKEQCLSDRYTAPVTPLAYTLSIPFLATIKPVDTFLMGDKVTLVYDDLECSMPLDSSPSPRLDVLGERKVDINLPFGEHLDTLSTRDREINFNQRDKETNDLILVSWVFDEPLGNSDSVPRSYDVTFSNPLFDFNDDYTLCYDYPLFDEEFEDISSLDPPPPRVDSSY